MTDTLTPVQQATLTVLAVAYEEAQSEYSAANAALARKVGAAHDDLRKALAATFNIENAWQIEMSDFWTCPSSPTRYWRIRRTRVRMSDMRRPEGAQVMIPRPTDRSST